MEISSMLWSDNDKSTLLSQASAMTDCNPCWSVSLKTYRYSSNPYILTKCFCQFVNCRKKGGQSHVFDESITESEAGKEVIEYLYILCSLPN